MQISSNFVKLFVDYNKSLAYKRSRSKSVCLLTYDDKGKGRVLELYRPLYVSEENFAGVTVCIY
jgi:hypothetical protein